MEVEIYEARFILAGEYDEDAEYHVLATQVVALQGDCGADANEPPADPGAEARRVVESRHGRIRLFSWSYIGRALVDPKVWGVTDDP